MRDTVLRAIDKMEKELRERVNQINERYVDKHSKFLAYVDLLREIFEALGAET